ncbi:uncharacterized protein COLE_02895 [Cutaneotrichosporon oleaginosum]|uniref:uncharacterized protein n=1 Tax=Cutaneotrichosporon oleaginosum TaxID=879819 RepID=UPI0013235FE6|nr:hypothetical protein COLE_02895 [Cutaneotrichosporon oleaginosum]
MKLLALLVTLAAATPISIDEPDTRQIGGKCYGVLDGWCPGSNAIKYVPSRAGCFEVPRTVQARRAPDRAPVPHRLPPHPAQHGQVRRPVRLRLDPQPRRLPVDQDRAVSRRRRYLVRDVGMCRGRDMQCRKIWLEEAPGAGRFRGCIRCIRHVRMLLILESWRGCGAWYAAEHRQRDCIKR